MNGNDDVKEQLDKTQAELEQVRSERDRLSAEIRRRNLAAQLASELSKKIDGRAASEVAEVLAAQCRVTSDGTAMHDGLEAIGVDHIADKYLRGRGAFLLKTAPIGGRKVQAKPTEPQFSIEKAVKDLKHDAEWERADPEGREKAWEEHLAKIAARR